MPFFASESQPSSSRKSKAQVELVGFGTQADENPIQAGLYPIRVWGERCGRSAGNNFKR